MMEQQLLVVLISLLTVCSVVGAEVGLRILPTAPGKDGESYVAKSGKKFVVACVFESDEPPSKLQWTNQQGAAIDGETSASLFTIDLPERVTKHRKTSLIFPSIKDRDAGVYVCKAKTADGEELKTNIRIVVVESVKWTDTQETVGAMVGETLVVDCSANGEPEPKVSIEQADGMPLSADRFVVAGTEATIDSLTKGDSGTVVVCSASQVYSELGYTYVQTKHVQIQTWFPPEFEADEETRHGIVHRNASLLCNVTDSSPRATDFQFFKGDTLLNDPQRYFINIDHSRQHAVLHIKNVTEDDYAQYRCQVGNGKAFASHIINFKQEFPPGPPQTSLENADFDQITWKLRPAPNDQSDLPVVEYEIRYLRRALLPTGLIVDPLADQYDRVDEIERVWAEQQKLVRRKKSGDDLYTISGLLPENGYLFRFRAVNEAGFGESLELNAETRPTRQKSEISPQTAGASTVYLTRWSTVVISALMLIVQLSTLSRAR